MKRRNFIVNGLLIAGGAMLSGAKTLLAFAGNAAAPRTDGFSQIPRKTCLVARSMTGNRSELLTDGNTRIVLNEVGTFIWDRIDDTVSCDHIADQLCAEFDIDRHTAGHDVERFISGLEEQGLVILDRKCPRFVI